MKTSLAPGLRVVMDYYEWSGLLPFLEALGFHLVGFGCATCIGNSGPIDPAISTASRRLALAAVLSGNRNFEGGINPDVRMNYLASPPTRRCLRRGRHHGHRPHRRRDRRRPRRQPRASRRHLAPAAEVQQTICDALRSDMFTDAYRSIYAEDERWNSLEVSGGDRYQWMNTSTYVHRPPFFDAMTASPEPLTDITDARCLAKLGDSITTDHISPAGSIAPDTPAGRWLIDRGVAPEDF